VLAAAWLSGLARGAWWSLRSRCAWGSWRAVVAHRPLGSNRVGSIATGRSLLALRSWGSWWSLRSGWPVDLDDASWGSLRSWWSWRSLWSLQTDGSLQSVLSLVAVLSVLSGGALGSSWALLAWSTLVSGHTSGADNARLVGDSGTQDASILAAASVLAIVTVISMFTIITRWAWWSGWSLLAVAARGSWLWIHDSVAGLSLLSRQLLLLVEDGDLSPHVTRARLAELGLGDEMALESGHIGVEHGQGDHAADHGSGGDHNGEEGHAAQLAVLLGLTIVVVENYWLFLSLIHLLSLLTSSGKVRRMSVEGHSSKPCC